MAAVFLALVAISAPVYWLGLVSLYLFASDIGQFPVFPGSGAYQNADGFFAKIPTLLLPWIVLAAAFSAIYARLTRSNLLEVMSEDYVRTARAKGLTERTVVMRHAFRNALIPITTIIALDLGGLISGAVLTETVFAWSGMGALFVQALHKVDLNPLMGFFLVTSITVIVFNFLADIVYSALDPRIRVTA